MPEPKPRKPSILLQLDTDPQPSVFDAVVAVDAGVDHLFRHANVRPEAVRDLVYGLLFTRGGDDLKRSAVFVGGSDFEAGEAVLQAVRDTCFGPFRVSVLHDSKGANTTASAAVLAVELSLGGPSAWKQAKVAILGMGPVGRTIARLLVRLGVTVWFGDPDEARLDQAMDRLDTEGVFEPFRIQADQDWQSLLKGASVIIAAGPAGVEVLPTITRDRFPHLKAAVDLNAVPPHGLGGVRPTDSDQDRDGVRVWGALGVGAIKMKIHKAVVRALFDGEPTVFDVDQVVAVGRQILAQSL